MASAAEPSEYQVARVMRSTGMTEQSARRHLEAIYACVDDPAFGLIAQRYRTELHYRREVDAQQARYQQQYDAWHASCDAARDKALAEAWAREEAA